MNNRKINVLFVSLSFPPKSDPEGLQTAKYFHYLQKHQDLQIDVVTSALPTLYMPYDPDLEHYAQGVHQLISIPLKENRYINYLRARLGLQETAFPDSKRSFFKQYRKVLKLLKEKPDVIYSRADPKSSTIMAYELKRKFNVPWILHMSDPWADCPLQNMSESYYKKNDEWERKCLQAADVVTLTSVPTIDFYKKKYPEWESKFRLFPNVYESANAVKDETPVDTKQKFRIVYTGGLADNRSPEFLLKPLSELASEDPTLENKFEVIFAGNVDARNRAVFQKYNLPFVKWIGMLPFKEALRLQRSADYLVVIDNPIEDPSMSMFFPSKLLDYMVARKRILAITTNGSASHQVMLDLKGDVCHHNETDAIKAAILKSLKAFEAENTDYLVSHQPPEKYEALHNADRLYHEIIKLVDV